jgi:hypothetical protein
MQRNTTWGMTCRMAQNSTVAKQSLSTARGPKSSIFLAGLVLPIENLPSRYGTSFAKYYQYAVKRGLPAPRATQAKKYDARAGGGEGHQIFNDEPRGSSI